MARRIVRLWLTGTRIDMVGLLLSTSYETRLTMAQFCRAPGAGPGAREPLRDPDRVDDPPPDHGVTGSHARAGARGCAASSVKQQNSQAFPKTTYEGRIRDVRGAMLAGKTIHHGLDEPESVHDSTAKVRSGFRRRTGSREVRSAPGARPGARRPCDSADGRTAPALTRRRWRTNRPPTSRRACATPSASFGARSFRES